MRRKMVKNLNRTRPAELLDYVMVNIDAKVGKKAAIGMGLDKSALPSWGSELSQRIVVKCR